MVSRESTFSPECTFISNDGRYSLQLPRNTLMFPWFFIPEWIRWLDGGWTKHLPITREIFLIGVTVVILTDRLPEDVMLLGQHGLPACDFSACRVTQVTSRYYNYNLFFHDYVFILKNVLNISLLNLLIWLALITSLRWRNHNFSIIHLLNSEQGGLC